MGHFAAIFKAPVMNKNLIFLLIKTQELARPRAPPVNLCNNLGCPGFFFFFFLVEVGRRGCLQMVRGSEAARGAGSVSQRQVMGKGCLGTGPPPGKEAEHRTPQPHLPQDPGLLHRDPDAPPPLGLPPLLKGPWAPPSPCTCLLALEFTGPTHLSLTADQGHTFFRKYFYSYKIHIHTK